MTADRIRALAALLPEESACFDADRPSWPLDRDGRREARISFALARPDFAWLVASTFAEQGRLVPACVQIPAIRRANYHLLGYRDPGIAEAASLMHPNQGLRRLVLNGLLCARDVDLPGIAVHLSLKEETVALYADLFYNVRPRLEERAFILRILYPGTRIGRVNGAEDEWKNSELIFPRVGYEYGSKAVLKLAGRIPLGDGVDVAASLEKLGRETVGNARMLVGIGHLNRAKSPGIRRAQKLATARRKARDQSKSKRQDALTGMGMALPINTKFMELMKPELLQRLAVMKGLPAEKEHTPGENLFKKLAGGEIKDWP